MTTGEELNKYENAVNEQATPRFTNVVVNTWASHSAAGKGIAAFMDTAMFGANCGHASVAVTFPADDTGISLIKKYCLKDGENLIPHHRHPKTVWDPVTQKPITQDVFTVYFSWWPGGQDAPHSLFESKNIDSFKERDAVDMGPLNPRFEAVLGDSIETRIARGKLGLGEKKITLAPRSIAHTAGLNELQKEILSTVTNQHEISENITSLTVLQEKLDGKKNNLPTKGTLKILLDRFVPNWPATVADPKNLQSDEILKLSEKVSQLIEESTQSKKELAQKQANLMGEYTNEYYSQMVSEANEIKDKISTLNNPTPADIEKIFAKYPKASVLTYQAMKAKREQSEIKQVLAFLKPSEGKRPTIAAMREALYHQKLPEEMSEEAVEAFRNWRNYLPEDLREIAENEIVTPVIPMLYKALEAERDRLAVEEKNVRAEWANVYEKNDNFQMGMFEKVLTIGLDSDNTVVLPVRGIQKTDLSKNPGMNIEAMLEKMQETATKGGEFDLYDNNCSSTVGAILAAGAEPELKHYFEEKAAGFYGTPQVVYNAAVHYQDNVIAHNGKIPLSEKINRYNPLTMIPNYTGNLIHDYMGPKTGIAKAAALVLPIIGLGIISGACLAIKSLANPQKSYGQCRRFMNYAWGNPSRFLKVCSVPVAALATVLAAPAAVQTGFTRLVTAVRAKPIPAEDKPIKRATSPIKEKTITIDDPDPKSALARFHQVLETKRRSIIPVFETKTFQAVKNYLNKLDKENVHDKAILDQYESDTKDVFERIKEKTLPAKQQSQNSPQVQNQTTPHTEVDAESGHKYKRIVNYGQKASQQAQKRYQVTYSEKPRVSTNSVSSIPKQDPQSMTMSVQANVNGKTFQTEMMVSQNRDVVSYDVSNEVLHTLGENKNIYSQDERQAALNVLKSDLLFALTEAEPNMSFTVGQKYVNKGANTILLNEMLNENPEILDVLYEKNLTIQFGKKGTPIPLNSLIDNIDRDIKITNKPR